MNKVGFIGVAASTATLLCLGACADMDKLAGNQAPDYIPSPAAQRADAQASADSASADAHNAAAATDKSQRK